MSSTSISLIIPLDDARRADKTGYKATNLAKLMASHFAVPRGYVISADAYRAHLWASGARELASAHAEAEDREKIRYAILSSRIPDDIAEAVAEAYKRLSLQTGERGPKVAVRPSSIDRDTPGAYESYVNVSGVDELLTAVKRIWASVWGGKAAAYRMRCGSTSEPAVAVIVQQMVYAGSSGTALTANPVTGDPHKVTITCALRAPQNSAADTVQYVVDLATLSIARGNSRPGPGLDTDSIHRIAEAAVRVEEVVSGRAEIEWAYGGNKLWLLQARRIDEVPPHFPADPNARPTAAGNWRRATTRPISQFARSRLQNESVNSTAAKMWPEIGSILVLNGYVYARHTLATSSRPGADSGRLTRKETGLAFRLLMELQRVRPELDAISRRVIESDLSGREHRDLQIILSDISQAARVAAEWHEIACRLARRFTEGLREIVGNTSECRALLGGLADPNITRDALLQELGERFADGDNSGKLTEDTWWRNYRRDVTAFAQKFGYSFKDESEMFDAALWTSWVENTEDVFRMIGALARRSPRPSLATAHVAAEQEAEHVAARVQSGLKGREHGRFRKLLSLSRSWLAARSETEQSYALAWTSIRLVIGELGRRLCSSRTIADSADVFHFTYDELVGMNADPNQADRASLTALVARRKHEIWLDERLVAPLVLRAEEEPASDQAPSLDDATLSAVAVSEGRAAGRARMAETLADAGEIENGDILVVRHASATWTPFFALAGGIVAESGDELSYAAQVARLLGMPAVFGCDLISSIENGRKVVVDGSGGSVELGYVSSRRAADNIFANPV
ncbi:MAG: hypothetical protein A2Z18_04750 [Armatimonadetes bacterium RBG_16_58_9]|nr:MAG: hypothetical protein A2Z18_04750 [Armatimonadetes bacterium RBG_16_58_9]